jgi:DNA-cytosine methyltransferase
MEKTIKVGSDFSGVGAFDYAIKRIAKKKNFKVETIFSCDWDKYARITYAHNHGEPKYFPKDVYEREIPQESLDIYMTSPPCQAFSIAGKRQGKNDSKGILFFNSHEFIKENKPRFFIFENVKGLLSNDNGKTFNEWVNMLGGKSVNGSPILFSYENSVPYHLYYQVLNSKKHGVPQSRERIFIVGIRDDLDNNFQFPKEEHLIKRLKDILETEVDPKYFLSKKLIAGLEENKKYNNKRLNENLEKHKGQLEDGTLLDSYNQTIHKDKSNTITTRVNASSCTHVVVHNLQKRSADRPSLKKNKNAGGSGHLSKSDGTTYCLDTGNTQAVEIKRQIITHNIPEIVSVRKYEVDILSLQKTLKEHKKISNQQIADELQVPKTMVEHWFRTDTYFSIPDKDIWAKLKELLEITTNEFDESIITFEEREGTFEKSNRVYDEDGIAPTLTTMSENERILVRAGDYRSDEGFRWRQDGNSPTIMARAREDKYGCPMINDNYNIRRLTPRECFRLQDFPDTFDFSCVSDSQSYKQAGNSITVRVLEKIIDKLKL